MMNRSNYVPMWSVSRPNGAHPLSSQPGLGEALYKHFSGANAERRAHLFAERHGLRVTPGMGNRSGWCAAEVWNAEQFIAAVEVLAGRRATDRSAS